MLSQNFLQKVFVFDNLALKSINIIMLEGQNPVIAVIDSGIGGVSILKQLIEKFHSGNFIYFADNLYMPYGNKSKIWLNNRLKTIINEIKFKYKADYIIIACNTASASIEISEYTNVITMKFLKDYVYFATNLTKKNLSNLNVIADKTLAKKIENYIFDNKKLNQIVKQHVKYHKLNYLESYVLGCTHYELVKPIFEKYCSKTKIINNSSFVINSIEIKNKIDELNIVILTSMKDEKIKEKVRRLLTSY